MDDYSGYNVMDDFEEQSMHLNKTFRNMMNSRNNQEGQYLTHKTPLIMKDRSKLLNDY